MMMVRIWLSYFSGAVFDEPLYIVTCPLLTENFAILAAWTLLTCKNRQRWLQYNSLLGRELSNDYNCQVLHQYRQFHVENTKGSKESPDSPDS